jgi:hypothetical protein
MGRADKGIILTTGSFTAEARKEAVRDGVPPIELADADKPIGMLEQLELGLNADQQVVPGRPRGAGRGAPARRGSATSRDHRARARSRAVGR